MSGAMTAFDQRAREGCHADAWVHVPTPGDHYSPRTGSAVSTLIHQVCRLHPATSHVVVQRGTMDGYEVGERVEVDYPRLGTPPAWAKVADRTAGVLTSRRLFSGLPYVTAADAIGHGFRGVVFVHNEPSGIEVLARRCPKARICLWVQNELFKTYTDRQVRRVLRFAHRVICCSDFIARGIRSRGVGDDPKVVAVLNGVDVEQFKPDAARSLNAVPVILFVGRMVENKGPHILLQAATMLKQRGARLKVRFVGSAGFSSQVPLSPYEVQLRDLAREVQDVVEFVPFVDRAKIAAHYQQADIFCAPSTWEEPFALTVLEAMAAGLSVVAADRGGIPEVIGSCGSLFEPKADALANLLWHLIHEPVARSTGGTRARERALTLSWRNHYDRLAKIVR